MKTPIEQEKPKSCTFQGCRNKLFSRKYCAGHYKQLTQRGGRLIPLRSYERQSAPCKCGEKAVSLGLCRRHYDKKRKAEKGL